MQNKWSEFIDLQMRKPEGLALKLFLKQEREKYTIYPSAKDTLSAFKITPFENIKVVIYGQDPYHGPGQANGLAFSVSAGTPIPPSLSNIFKEYGADLGHPPPSHGDLTKWAREGVMLLNTTLTVRESSPMSHAGHGWEEFTSAALKKVSDELSGVVFILWGNHAKSALALIDQEKHTTLISAHPSPLSAYRGFFGSKPFSRANTILELAGKQPIDWLLN